MVCTDFKDSGWSRVTDTDKEWQLRSVRCGDGWAYDSTHSHCKRAKSTQTDPEDDRNTDPSLPMGSTSKTYDPRKDGSFWKRTGSGQEWSVDYMGTTPIKKKKSLRQMDGANENLSCSGSLITFRVLSESSVELTRRESVVFVLAQVVGWSLALRLKVENSGRL